MKKPQNYVPYHIHSMLSNGVTNIDSITNYKDYIEAATKCGMTAFGFSEHGSIFEWLHKKEAIEKAGMKYIHGVEAYITADDNNKPHLYSAVDLFSSEMAKGKDIRVYFYTYWKSEDGKCLTQPISEPNKDKVVWIDENTIKDEGYKKERDNYHCVLIAKNYDGVKELNALVSKSFRRDDFHFYYTPRISFDELFSTSDNIIITTACLGGVLNNGTPLQKEKMLSFLAEHKDRCFLEIQHHCCQEQIEYNKTLYSLSQATGIPLIAGTDTHALNDEHMEGRAILQKAKGVHFSNEDDWDLTFKSIDELLTVYQKQNSLPMEVIYEAIENTNKMADMVEEFKLDYSAKYPKLYDDSEAVFKEKINAGVISRGIKSYPNYREYVDRIRNEYDTYKHNNAIDFMLLEEDYKSEMRRRNIKFGYSRGSVSGSIIAYLLGITEVDSVKFNLNFERFMNRERVSLADIDTDWLSEDRKVVKEYLYTKQGLYCCDIVTFNTIALKGAIDDVCRALYKSEYPASLKKRIESDIDGYGKLTDATKAECDKYDKQYLDIAEKIKNEVEVDEDSIRKEYPKVFKYVDLVNGVVVSVGNHPAGCVVSPFPVESWFGTFSTSTDEYPISQLNMKEIDSLNFVKLDILGLDNIGLIYKTCDAAGIPFLTPDNTPPDDMDVWNSIKEDTTMIFQWESASATAYLKQLFSDSTIEKIKEKNPNFSYMDLLSIGNGAIRPAGESYRDYLAQGIYRDNGNEALNDFLSSTLGYLVYQEQIIEFLHKFCGFTMGEADIVRRHFSKKTGTEKDIPIIKDGGKMSDTSEHYIAGFIKTMQDNYNVGKEESEKIIINFLQVIQDASDYLFSKNHADPYSWIGYICGYLRYHYPLEFITTALNIFEGKEEKSLAIIDYAKKHGIKISPIKFRHSIAQYNFDKDTNEIFKGISSIKYMNSTVADEIYALKNNQYDTFIDLLKDLKEKTSINQRQLLILIELDFFAEFGDANLLIQQNELFNELFDKVQFKKDKLSQLGVDEAVVRKYAQRETEKMFTGVNVYGLLKEMTSQIRYSNRTLSEKIKAQIKHLGYLDIADNRYNRMAAVLSVNTKYAPKLKMYSLKNGTTLDCKIKKTIFAKEVLAEGDIVKILGTKNEPKKRMDEHGNWVNVPGTNELWITSYQKVVNI